MDEEERKKIIKLSTKAHNAEVKFNCLSMLNTFGLTAEERLQQRIEYDLAKAEMLEAKYELTSTF